MTTKKLATPLSRKAVLVSVAISQWTARKLDKKVTAETNTRYHAASDAIRANKLLLEKGTLVELSGLVSRARHLHYRMTRPWADDGPRILANVLFHKFSEEFGAIEREFNAAADRFARDYPRFVQERKKALNGLFDAADYPAPQDIRAKFKLEKSIMAFPDAEDFRADLDDDTVADIKAQINATSDAVVDNAMKHTAQQIIETVGHMATRLAEYRAGEGKGDKSEGVFRDSLVENVRELADLLPAFNLTDDPKLTAITKRIKTELCAEDAADLRKNDTVRASVQKSADEIIAQVGALFA
jgi:hypothetical protein